VQGNILYNLLLIVLFLLPATGFAEINPEKLGIGTLCAYENTQIDFYSGTKDKNTSGTLTFKGPFDHDYAIASSHYQTLEEANITFNEYACDDGAPGFSVKKLVSNRVQLGKIWVALDNKEKFIDWKSKITGSNTWHAVAPFNLYAKLDDAASIVTGQYNINPQWPWSKDIYPEKIVGNWAYVQVDETDAYSKSCEGNKNIKPHGKKGWMQIMNTDDTPLVIPAYPKGC
jgi:hypothetical protein